MTKFVAQLTPKWRVVDDGSQWVLQRRERAIKAPSVGSKAAGDGWRAESFSHERGPLICCILEKVFLAKIDLIGTGKYIETKIPGQTVTQKIKRVEKRWTPPEDFDHQAMAIVKALPKKHPQPYVQRKMGKPPAGLELMAAAE